MRKRSHNNLFRRKNLRIGDMKSYTHRARERHKEVSLINKNATVTNDNQPLQKVTKSLYMVTHLGQQPFMLITQMARTWAIKEDSVNTSIIHLYSTGFARVGRIRRQKTELVGLEELKPIVSEPMSVVRNHPALCPASTGPICCYAHLLLSNTNV